jgi:hypothetical protein
MNGYSNRSNVQVASGLNVLVAIWLFVSPWALGYGDDAGWNSTITAVVIAAIALIRVFGAYGAAWLSWLNLVLGVWLVVSPWVLNYDNNGATWNSVIVGIVVGLLAIWSATSSRMTTPAATA